MLRFISPQIYIIYLCVSRGGGTIAYTTVYCNFVLLANNNILATTKCMVIIFSKLNNTMY